MAGLKSGVYRSCVRIGRRLTVGLLPATLLRQERISPSPLESRLRCVEFFMVRNWTPSIVPRGHDQTVYLVADDFGRIGRAWIEADYEGTDLETIIQDLMSGQYNNPVRVIA